MKTKNTTNLIKTKQVNNAIYHLQFDPRPMSDEIPNYAKAVLGYRETNSICEVTEEFDKRYYQKHPNSKLKQKKQKAAAKLSFRQECRKLYTGPRLKLENALVDMQRNMKEKELLGYFDNDKLMQGKVPFPEGASDAPDIDSMRKLLEDYRFKLFPQSKLEDFLPPSNLTADDIRKLMEKTGRIKKGVAAYEPFAEYLKQKAIYEERFNKFKKKTANQNSI